MNVKTKIRSKVVKFRIQWLVSIDSLVAEIESLDESKLEVTDLGFNFTPQRL